VLEQNQCGRFPFFGFWTERFGAGAQEKGTRASVFAGDRDALSLLIKPIGGTIQLAARLI
jgi:hypothetical protein